MIRLRYPVGLGIASAMLVVVAIALTASAAEALAEAIGADGVIFTEQPSQDELMAYYGAINLQYSLTQLVPWIVLAAALIAIGALMLVVLRSRQVSIDVSRD